MPSQLDGLPLEPGGYCAHPCHGLKPEIVALDGLDLVTSRISPVPVHHEGDMSRNWALFQRSDDGLAQMFCGPFRWRRAEEPAANAREIEIRHLWGVSGRYRKSSRARIASAEESWCRDQSNLWTKKPMHLDKAPVVL